MEYAVLSIVIVVVVAFLINRERDFDDPKPMSSQRLLSAIAGQVDWLEKMSQALIESRNSPSIVEFSRKQRSYIARLCVEVVSRGAPDGSPNNQELRYPGATAALNVFAEDFRYAKELEAAGDTKGKCRNKGC